MINQRNLPYGRTSWACLTWLLLPLLVPFAPAGDLASNLTDDSIPAIAGILENVQGLSR